MAAVITQVKSPLRKAEARWPVLGLFKRPARFGMVGVSGIVVNSVVLGLLVYLADAPLWLSSVGATEVAILSNFFLNDRWTFRAQRHHRPLWGRLLRFNGVALLSMAVTVSVLTALMSYLLLPLLAANILAIGAATAVNYSLNSLWTWRRPAPGQEGSPAA
jgi:putative flippase GtrA